MTLHDTTTQWLEADTLHGLQDLGDGIPAPASFMTIRLPTSNDDPLHRRLRSVGYEVAQLGYALRSFTSQNAVVLIFHRVVPTTRYILLVTIPGEATVKANVEAWLRSFSPAILADDGGTWAAVWASRTDLADALIALFSTSRQLMHHLYLADLLYHEMTGDDF